jgi:hypothetical protein
MKRCWKSALIVAALAFGAAGCVSKSEANGVASYGFECWVIAIPAAVGLGIVAIALAMWRKRARIKSVLVGLLGLAAAIGGTATIASDRLTIDAQGMLQTGWGHGFNLKYAEVAGVQLIQEERIGRRGRRVQDLKMVVRSKRGGTETHPVGDLLKQAWNDMAAAFRQHGVPLDVAPNVTELP